LVARQQRQLVRQRARAKERLADACERVGASRVVEITPAPLALITDA
jgi:hypothetical protein